MVREEIRNRIIEHLKQVSSSLQNDPPREPTFKMTDIDGLFLEDMQEMTPPQKNALTSTLREIIHELLINMVVYVGSADANAGRPFFTLTRYGLKALENEDWLTYDPEGYIEELKARMPDLDDVTLRYMSEAIDAYNRRKLLSATITLGVASENIVLLLIDAYVKWLTNRDQSRGERLEKKIEHKVISIKYKLFNKELTHDIKDLPQDLRADWEVNLDGIFGYIRFNRNNAGHPTGKAMNTKTVAYGLQIFSDYAERILQLISFFNK